jgi:hypothetical protein
VRSGLLLALLAAASAASAAEMPASPSPLRTLFHSAAQRDELDRLRRGEPAEAATAKRGAPAVTGFVHRSDGRDTVWLDGRAVTGPEANKLADPGKVREDGGGSRAIEIKPSR